MIIEPKYAIGSPLFPREHIKFLPPHTKQKIRAGEAAPRVMTVLEIQTQTCYAGTQIFYRVRPMDGTNGGGSEILTFSEPELMPYYEAVEEIRDMDES